MVKITAKNWLDNIPNKDKIEVLGRACPSWLKDKGGFWELKKTDTLEGELRIDSFSNLKVIYLGQDVGAGKGSLTKVTIVNCPKLEHIDFYNNEINELDVSNLVNLKILIVSDNNLGKIKVVGCKNLQSIEAKGNKDTKLEGLEDLKNFVNIRFSAPFLPVQELKNLRAITDPVKGLNNILKTDGTVDEVKLKEYKDMKSGPTQDQLTQAQNKIKDLEAKEKKLTGEKNNLQTQLTTANNLITSTQTKLNIPNLNQISQLPSGETIATLLQRPTQAQLTTANNNLITSQNAKNLVDQKLKQWNDSFPNQTPERVKNSYKLAFKFLVENTTDEQLQKMIQVQNLINIDI